MIQKNTTPLFDTLYRLLANEHALYLQTLSCHWNVVGPHFNSYHALFGEQYAWLAEAVDLLAEQLRILGEFVPVQQFSQYSTLDDIKPTLSAAQMLVHLCQSHQTVADQLVEGITFFNEKVDYSTADLLTELLRTHEKMLWVLRSHA